MEGRKFIGIGKILIDTLSEDWNIPNLHFIVSRITASPQDGHIFEAVNLEFGLVSIGDSGSDAAQSLANHIVNYIIVVMREGRGYIEFRELARNNFMSELWTEYRGIEFDLAETGDDLSHYMDKRINKAIQDSFSDKLKEVIERKADDLAEELISMLSMLRPPVVEYKEISEAA